MNATTYTTDYNAAELEIRTGLVCGAAAVPRACVERGSPLSSRHLARLALTAGEEIQILGSRALDLNYETDGTGDLTAPYSISILSCTPSCLGKVCGNDGCGGSCGGCSGTDYCAGGVCRCSTQCLGKNCGPDGCGGSCGSCLVTQACSGAGQCVCTPACTGKTCGPNGCGGTCGLCGFGTACSGSTCVSDPDNCDPVTNTFCAAPNQCVLLSTEQTVCVLTGTGTQGSSCSATNTCSGGFGCFANICRKICSLPGGAGCVAGTCIGVSGWALHGACQ